MSYVNSIEIVQNDYGYDLQFQLTDASGSPVDLTGATLKIFAAEPDKAIAKVVGDCVVVGSPTGGLCKYTVQEADFDEAPKEYNVEIEITYATKVVTARGVVIRTVTELPEATT